MAKNKCFVYLGYEDEYINDKNKSLVDYTTNKIGGEPNWPYSDLSIPSCPICGLKRLLIAQIYAPLENSQFHRTLYVFTCLNPICSNQSESWICIRSQLIEKELEKDTRKSSSQTKNNITWCDGSDDWDDTENQMSISDNENCNEENGNSIKNENRISDEDEETNSIEFDPIPLFGNLQVDEKNANCGAQGGGAVGRIHSPNPSAEIEGEESEVVTIETPVAPQRDLVALFKQTPAIPGNLENVTLKSFFIAVDEEKLQIPIGVTEHVRELMQEYQSRDDTVRTTPDSPGNVASGGFGVSNNDADQEQYEKGTPAHGDIMFHNFLTRIQENPGQILRYSRDSTPLIIRPLLDKIPKCLHCGSDVLCEIQILPTLIPKLRLDNGDTAPIEYGNVLIFTCTQNCWDTPDKFRSEHIIVQPEI